MEMPYLLRDIIIQGLKKEIANNFGEIENIAISGMNSTNTLCEAIKQMNDDIVSNCNKIYELTAKLEKVLKADSVDVLYVGEAGKTDEEDTVS